jgi:hypothetical protein
MILLSSLIDTAFIQAKIAEKSCRLVSGHVSLFLCHFQDINAYEADYEKIACSVVVDGDHSHGCSCRGHNAPDIPIIG